MDVGYVYNFNGGRTSSRKEENPITGEDSQDFNLNKVQISLAKELPEENRLAAGFVFVLEEKDHHEHRYGPGSDRNSATAFGLALYTRYQLCDWFSLGGRLEYLHANDGTLGFVDGLNVNSIDQNQVFVSSTDLYSWTLTAGFDIWVNMVLRLEYRLDMSSSNSADNLGAFGNNQDEQHTFALNAAYLF